MKISIIMGKRSAVMEETLGRTLLLGFELAGVLALRFFTGSQGLTSTTAA